MKLIKKIFEYDIKNGAEFEAIDLLIEVDRLDLITDKLDKTSALKTSSYLLSCSQYIPSELPQSAKILRIAFTLFLRHGNSSEALRVACIADDEELINECFENCKSQTEKEQLALYIGLLRKQVPELKNDEKLSGLSGNESLSKWFDWLSKQLNVDKVKELEDIYKSNLIDRSTFKKYSHSRKETSKETASARENLASTFVNAFVHAGFGHDNLVSKEDSEWVFKNRDVGMASAAASLGLVNLWGLENGYVAIDRYSESSEEYVKAGSLIAFGIVSAGITSELDAATAILLDYLESDSDVLRLFALIGIGIASASCQNPELAEPLEAVIMDFFKPEICSFGCMTVGLVNAASCEESVAEGIFEVLMYYSDTDVYVDTFAFMCLGMGLTFICSGEKSEGIYEALEVIGGDKGQLAKSLVSIFAHAGSGNVLRFQETLRNIECRRAKKEEETPKETEKGEENKSKESEKKSEKNSVESTKESNKDSEKEKPEDKSEDKEEDKEKSRSKDKKVPRGPDFVTEKDYIEAINVIGLAAISMGEKLSKKMCYKVYDDLLRYENLTVRRAVPLGLALLFVSNPEYSVVGLLGKLSHDADERLSLNAIFALGIVSAGTNNSRVAKLLRNLAVYYQKDADHLFLTRVSQGLVYCAKGLVTLNPYLQDGVSLNKNALAGLLIVLISCIDIKKLILGKKHYLLYYLSLAIRPRMLITVDENMKPIEVPVRVGQAVDNVRLAGESKTITGFQTHQTPVLLSSEEKAELATKKYLPLTSELEGIVILKPNPSFVSTEEMSTGSKA